MSSFFPAIARPAVIMDVNHAAQTCTIQYADRAEVKLYTCPLPHPFVGAGWGIFVGPTRGTRVLVDSTLGDQPFIVATIAMNQFSGSLNGQANLAGMRVSQAAYPVMHAGEVVIQSQAGSALAFDRDGKIRLSNNDIRLEYSNSGAAALTYRSSYTNTEAHREISGLIRRDIRTKPREIESSQNKLTSADADKLWSTIGRNPTIEPALLTLNLNDSNKTTRNPVLAEHRSLVYEFARTSMAGGYKDEAERIEDSDHSFLSQPNRRDMSRTDVFNLGPHLPNNLIERIEGTAIDIYGNMLDLNRNIIDFNQVKIGDAHRIEHENILLRRAIKYHFEINSRKHNLGIDGDSDNLDSHNPGDQACKNGYAFSRWSIDVDGEGLTKINIPSSSNVGNIPLLTRHINQYGEKDRNAGDFRPPADTSATRRDIQHVAFGDTDGEGISIPQTYAPPNIVKDGNEFVYRTAYHDVIAIGAEILADTGDDTFVNTSLNNDLLNPAADAGGRSVHANLDGSLELNVGRDTADKKSILLDTAGSLIAHLGRDSRNNSVVAQTDGDVLMQVGGSSVRGESQMPTNAFKLYVSDGSGNFHKIEVKDEGIFITSATNSNIVIQSQNNLILDAKGQVFVGGKDISLYGSFADSGNTISSQRRIERIGGVL